MAVPLHALLVAWALLALPVAGQPGIAFPPATDIQSFDGYFNNPSHPTWGSRDQEQLRRVLPAFADGSYIPAGYHADASSGDNADGAMPRQKTRQDRPNARQLSNLVFHKNLTVAEPHVRNLTAMFIFFGQQLVQEITESVVPSCPPEYLSVTIPRDDIYCQQDACPPVGEPEYAMPMVRSLYTEGTGTAPNHPRGILNEKTPFVDFDNLYGPNKPWNDALRSFSGGKLRVGSQQMPPLNEIGLPIDNPPPPKYHLDAEASGLGERYLDPRNNFMTGNRLGSENPAVLTLQALWLREHNRRADELAAANPGWNDEQLFNRARQWTIATYQHIAFDEWLPLLFHEDSPLGNYTEAGGYNEQLHPQIALEFSSVAMRMGHSMVPSGLLTRSSALDCDPVSGNIRLCQAFHNVPEVLRDRTLEQVLLGMASQVTENMDLDIVEDLRTFLFGPPQFSRRDLIALNIQRARDHGIADYNALRQAYGLARVTSWTQLAQQHRASCDATCVTLSLRLQQMYNDDLDDVDAWVGGMLEVREDIGVPGELFLAIIREQFFRLRHGDRFYWENPLNGLFSEDERNMIRNTTMGDIISRNGIGLDFRRNGGPLQDTTVFANDGMASGADCAVSLNERDWSDADQCSPLKRYDYSAQQVPQIAGLIAALVVFQIGVFAIRSCLMDRRAKAARARIEHMQGVSRRHRSGALSYRVRFDDRLTVGCVIEKSVLLAHAFNSPPVSAPVSPPVSPRDSAEQLTSPTLGSTDEERFFKAYASIFADHSHRRRLLIVLTSRAVYAWIKVQGTLLFQCVRKIPFASIEKLTLTSGKDQLNIHVSTEHHLLLYAQPNDTGDLETDWLANDLGDMMAQAAQDAGEQQDEAVTLVLSRKSDLRTLSKSAVQRQREVDRMLRRYSLRDIATRTRLPYKACARVKEVFLATSNSNVIDGELDVTEFTAAFGLAKGSAFAQRMFDLADTDNTGSVSFDQYLDMIKTITIGTRHDKMRLLFRVYDIHNTGKLTSDSLLTLIREMAQMNGLNLSDGDILASIRCVLCPEKMAGHADAVASERHVKFTVSPFLTPGAPDAASTHSLLTSPSSAINGDRSPGNTPLLRGRRGDASPIVTVRVAPATPRAQATDARSPVEDEAEAVRGNADIARPGTGSSGVTSSSRRTVSSSGSSHRGEDDSKEQRKSEAEDEDEEEVGMTYDQWVHFMQPYTSLVDNLTIASLLPDLPTTLPALEGPNHSQDVIANSLMRDAAEAMSASHGSDNQAGGQDGQQMMPRRISIPTEMPTIQALKLNASDWDVDRPKQSMAMMHAMTDSKMAIRLRHWLADNGSQASVLVMFVLLNMAIFVERAWTYRFEREGGGLRLIAGNFVAITRGAASVISFNLTLALVSMCRSLVTALRSTRLNNLIPFRKAVEFHQVIGVTTFAFSTVHVTGHMFNFFSVSSAPPPDVNCVLSEVFVNSHVIPDLLGFWVFGTLTGVTGVMLVLVLMVMAPFTMHSVRKGFFDGFWATHQLYVPLYVLTVLHGSLQLVQAPLFWHYCLWAMMLYTLDRIWRLMRSHAPLPVLSATKLPSMVVRLRIAKPRDFVYQAGQWVYIRCPEMSHEQHPFTVTSAPYERYLEFHVRVAGPWTRALYDRVVEDKSPVCAHIDGPFGMAHQSWNRFRTCLLVGAGIGVTPFASILKDILFRVQLERANYDGSLTLRKVYFIWVTRKQESWEWMTDLVRELEAYDVSHLLEMHLFITGAHRCHDLRSVMLWGCEDKFRAVLGRSMMTSARSRTHLGRPNWRKLLQQLQSLHRGEKIGVFTCGPEPLSTALAKAASKVSRVPDGTFEVFNESF